MSPRIEATDKYSFSVEGSPREYSYFVINLEPEGEFIPEEFDALAKNIYSDQNVSYLKYIVQGELLYIFSQEVMHEEVYDALNMAQNGKSLKSAGNIKVKHSFPVTKPKERRAIYSDSSSLKDRGLLTNENSDKYKMGELKEKLGPFFRFS